MQKVLLKNFKKIIYVAASPGDAALKILHSGVKVCAAARLHPSAVAGW
jgi:hypothetical protein